MNLDQFDKLQNLVKQTVDRVFQLRFENNKLRKENETLKQKLETFSGMVPEDLQAELHKLQQENKVLRDKNERAQQRLTALLEKVRNITEGVES